jgi:hypothetical protein
MRVNALLSQELGLQKFLDWHKLVVNGLLKAAGLLQLLLRWKVNGALVGCW